MVSSAISLHLPDRIEEQAIANFDKLLNQGEILYETPRTEIATINDIQFQLSTTSVLGPKPVLSALDPARSKPVGPFVDPPDDFIVARLGDRHTLIVNKYCVYRSMLILHTILFEPQTDDLNSQDIAAAWALLKAFKTPQMVIYNCGVESGSSQGHKHLQIFSRQDSSEFVMWPEKAKFCDEITTKIPNIPFAHFVIRLPTDVSADHVFLQYQRLLEETKKALRAANAGTDHNLILVPEWLALIPRTNKGQGRVIFNAANMVGLLWAKDDETREEIMGMIPGGLAGLGIPHSS